MSDIAPLKKKAKGRRAIEHIDSIVASKSSQEETVEDLGEPSGPEKLEAIQASLGDDVAEVVHQMTEDERRQVILAEMAESLRPGESVKISTVPVTMGLPKAVEKAFDDDEDDPYALDKLVLNRELSHQLIVQLATSIERYGNDISTACNKLLIDRQKVADWGQHGHLILQGLAEAQTPHDELCTKLVLALLKASARYENKLDRNIHEHANFMRWLNIAERRHPASWGKDRDTKQQEYTIDETFA